MVQISNGSDKLELFKSQTLVGLKGQLDHFNSDKILSNTPALQYGGFNLFQVDDKKKTDSILDQLRNQKEVELGTHVYFTKDSNKPIIPTGFLVIQFHPLTNQEEQHIVLEEFGLELKHTIASDTLSASCTKQSENPIKVCNKLEKLSMVLQAEPDFDIPMENYGEFPMDQLLKDQWQFENTGSISFTKRKMKAGADAKIKKAWEFMGNTGSPDIKIAIIDSGFDLNHPDFKGKITSPYDITTNSAKLITNSSLETHGTPCASIALANADASGLIGVAPNAQFMPIHKPSFSSHDLYEMFEHCIKNGADIISASWGTIDAQFPLNKYKKSIIRKAAKQGRNGKGAIVLFAAGNEGAKRINNFGHLPEVITVGATDSRDKHPSYSNTGPELTICAPSDGDIPVLAAKASWDSSKSLNDYINGPSSYNQYKAFGGTSAATPLVAGVCALILSVNPDLYAHEVKEILQKTADKVGSQASYTKGHSHIYGYGRINALEAVKEAKRRAERSKKRQQKEIKQDHNSEVIDVKTPKIDLNPPVIEKGNWTIQLGVFSKKSGAEKFAEQLIEKHDIKINIDEVEGINRILHRVTSQRFQTKETAKIFMAALTKKGINGFIKKLK